MSTAGEPVGQGVAFRAWVQIVSLLVAAGAAVDAEAREGRTPLLCASFGGNVEVLQILVQPERNLCARDF